jgi:hypothetical protein
MTSLYVFGKLFGRMSEEMIKEHVDSNLIDKALSIQDVNEIDDWMESEEVKDLPYNVQVLLGGIASDDFMEGQKSEINYDWTQNKWFHITMDEYSFGVGETANIAKAEYLKTESEEDDW